VAGEGERSHNWDTALPLPSGALVIERDEPKGLDEQFNFGHHIITRSLVAGALKGRKGEKETRHLEGGGGKRKSVENRTRSEHWG